MSPPSPRPGPSGGVLSQICQLMAGTTYTVSVGLLAIENLDDFENEEGGTIEVFLGGDLLHTFSVAGYRRTAKSSPTRSQPTTQRS